MGIRIFETKVSAQDLEEQMNTALENIENLVTFTYNYSTCFNGNEIVYSCLVEQQINIKR